MFKRGRCLQNATQSSSTTYAGLGYEGATREIVSEAAATLNPNTKRTADDVIVVAVRNVAAVALAPKMAVVWSTTAGEWGKRVDGYSKARAARVAGIVDEFLPSTGIRVGDMGWIVVKGQALASNQVSSDYGNIAIGNRVSAVTHTNSTDPVTAGRVCLQRLTGATQPLADEVQNSIGTALSAAVSNAGGDVLLDVDLW
jgi:hypothetical protein